MSLSKYFPNALLQSIFQIPSHFLNLYLIKNSKKFVKGWLVFTNTNNHFWQTNCIRVKMKSR